VDAMEAIKMNVFSLLILDIMMPDISGWELFSRISKIRPDYKVVFLSILEISESRLKELKDAGVKDYIRKPFDRNDFVSRVKTAITNK
jgi:DNA-binding response OmpR family regulator